mmetsp:Transcript_5406/g.13321  ORF Transcript_5406/g.13321 Transcript_5406/m.13321 type:complete len:221 (-) Transcript_5406:120-782(-)
MASAEAQAPLLQGFWAGLLAMSASAAAVVARLPCYLALPAPPVPTTRKQQRGVGPMTKPGSTVNGERRWPPLLRPGHLVTEAHLHLDPRSLAEAAWPQSPLHRKLPTIAPSMPAAMGMCLLALSPECRNRVTSKHPTARAVLRLWQYLQALAPMLRSEKKVNVSRASLHRLALLPSLLHRSSAAPPLLFVRAGWPPSQPAWTQASPERAQMLWSERKASL